MVPEYGESLTDVRQVSIVIGVGGNDCKTKAALLAKRGLDL
jgi:hypothetical protein